MNLKKNKITKSSVYNELLLNSNKVVGKYFVIVYKTNITKLDKKEELVNLNFGITASKKVGNAVKRNWCKRRIRLLVNQINIKDFTKTFYINIIARKFMIDKSFSLLKKDFDFCIKKITNYEKKSN
ncbi:ribonuclease P protein component [Candidatus Aquarickettsia rohweri]|uniref:ribonuclease P protein component n=1 Tax=Candidatus Aquarickettsia rohweri TaxID=2602574 RepID=UPI0012B3E58B|nr:ribonuclease P protein component [Candidatus Aquarickettsia rohweri]MSO14034.1 Ribonuclease P protein component [Rickettsiales endosymbiont of Trichoplax sp. H2]